MNYRGSQRITQLQYFPDKAPKAKPKRADKLVTLAKGAGHGEVHHQRGDYGWDDGAWAE
jgi:hypothetical protein